MAGRRENEKENPFRMRNPHSFNHFAIMLCRSPQSRSLLSSCAAFQPLLAFRPNFVRNLAFHAQRNWAKLHGTYAPAATHPRVGYEGCHDDIVSKWRKLIQSSGLMVTHAVKHCGWAPFRGCWSSAEGCHSSILSNINEWALGYLLT